MENSQTFVTDFRNSSAYIYAHRKQTFVIYFGGEILLEDFSSFIHDFALLNSLGIRLVLIYGIRPQIEAQLKENHLESQFKQHLRITDADCLERVKKIAGLVRVEIEALLSMGLANSPMAGTKIKVASGNFVTAKPLGVIDGVDFGYTGQVRKIDATAISQLLKHDNVVLISPLGYSSTGEVFSLGAAELAAEVACALKAKKLIFLTEESCCQPNSQDAIRQMTTEEALAFLTSQPHINGDKINTMNAAIQSCQHGVERVHLINRHHEGALLLELFTRDGIGTLISSTAFENLRAATLTDIGGILALIEPLEKQGKLVKRSKEKLEMQINDYIVIERDGLIIGCTALHVLEQHKIAEIACLAVHAEYEKQGIGQRLFESLIKKSQQQGLKRLFLLSTQTTHWFMERGFQLSSLESLPQSVQSYYNPRRNSKILSKDLF